MPVTELERFKDILRSNGHQITKSREAVFHLLLSSEPQSINELIKRAGKKVDRVTIYRNLELFEKLGILHRIYIGWKYKIELSDEFTGHHHHLSCLRCGKMIDIEDETHINEFITQVASQFGFTPRRHQFEIDGYCKDCAPVTATTS